MTHSENMHDCESLLTVEPSDLVAFYSLMEECSFGHRNRIEVHCSAFRLNEN